MAAQVVVGQGSLNFTFTQTDSSGLITPVSFPATFSQIMQLANATGVLNAVDTLIGQQLTLAAAPTHYNLHAATDIGSNSVVFARVRFWGVQVLTLTAGFIVNVYTRTGTNPVTWLPITTTGALWAPPGGFVCGYDPISVTTNGYVVGSGANDFTIDPGANTVLCNVVIAGNSVA